MSERNGLRDKGLKQLLKAFKGPLPVGRVGILGSKTARKEAGTTNAAIGAAHEYGTEHLPQRSFLRVPITDHLSDHLMEAGMFDKDKVEEVIKQGSLKAWVRKMTTEAEAIVLEAFATGGFGKWPTWKGSYHDSKGNRHGYQSKTGNILVDSTQLRNSITSDVK